MNEKRKVSLCQIIKALQNKSVGQNKQKTICGGGLFAY